MDSGLSIDPLHATSHLNISNIKIDTSLDPYSVETNSTNLNVHNRFRNALLGVILGLLSLLTIIMNLLVLYAVKRDRTLHTVGNLYIVSLSVADLIVGTTVMPLNLVYLLEDEWKLGRAVCQFWLIMDYVASTASIFSLFILCLDRYRSVRQPLKYLKYRTRGKASMMISGAWLLSMMWIVPILGWRSFSQVDLKPEEENKCDTDFRFVTWFKVITAIFNFYVPSILMLWFYMHIYRAVRQHLRDRERIIHPTDSFAENEPNEPMPEASKSPKKESEGLKKLSKTQSSLDQNILDQTYSLEETDRGKVAPFRKSLARGQQKCLLAMTKQRLPQKVNKCPLEQPKDSELPHNKPTVAKDIICSVGTNENEVQASLNQCHVSGPNSVSGNRISDIQGYKPGICTDCEANHSGTPWMDEDVQNDQLDPENEATLKQTWQKFIDNSRQRIQSLRIRKEHKAAKQLGFIIAAFLLCWIPYFIAFMVMAFCKECVHHDLHMFTIWLGYMNSTLNPFIYPLCNGNFKRVFKNILNIH
ncbi:histamine H1 receptor [Eucyclogobius newberryi]|uniref:histamine H1 receptor n=1 Tax=Eucyclogobius newberryi TaxID=166745 RepID=UPI003B5BC234